MSSTVAVSYSWLEEREGDHVAQVEAFCDALWEKGITVVRDKDELDPGASLSEFMRGIGESDHLCIFLSDAYLRSPNCMYELYIAGSRSQDNPEELRKRVKVWITPNVGNISDLGRRAEYIRYWKSEVVRLEGLVEEFGVAGLDPKSLAQYRSTKQFAENVDGLLAFFADILTPREFSEFQAWAESEFDLNGEDSDSTAEDEAKYAKLYNTVVTELNQLLNRHDSLCDFVRTACDDLVVKSGNHWALAEKVRTREFDDAIPLLESIEKQLPSVSLSANALERLEEFVGGLVVLTVNSEWVLNQENLLDAGAVFYPAIYRDSFVYLPDEGRANFLEIVAAALTKTTARLTHVFGPIEDIKELIPPLPLKGPAITKQDRTQELKRHLVKHVLGAQTPINDDETLDRLFSNVRRLISRARTKGNSFIAYDETFQPFIEIINRDLELQDLILIFPSGDDHEDAILKDSVIAMTVLSEIHECIEKLKSSHSPNPSS